MNSPQTNTRIPGILYLLVILFGVFAEMGVRVSLIVPDNPSATAANIQASEALFRLGIVSDMLMIACYLTLAFALYTVFKPALENLSLLFVLFTLASAAILSLNLLNQVAALLLVSGSGYLNAFSIDQLHALTLFFLKMQNHGYFIAQVFFGLWLLPLGYAGLKSGYLPRLLSTLVMAACFGHLIGFLQFYLFPAYEIIAAPGMVIATLAEFSLCLWLLVKGVRVPVAQSPA